MARKDKKGKHQTDYYGGQAMQMPPMFGRISGTPCAPPSGIIQLPPVVLPVMMAPNELQRQPQVQEFDYDEDDDY